MNDDKKPDEYEERLETDKKSKIRSFFKIKLTKWDVISIIVLIIFLILVSIPNYVSKGDCEIARSEYECDSIKNVMIENCIYWGSYDCNTDADVSLPQIEWYIGNLCRLQNQYHNTGLDCSNLKSACNQMAKNQVCPAGI